MKKLFILFLICFQCLPQTVLPPSITDPDNVEAAITKSQTFTIAPDKIIHMTGSYIISSTVSNYVLNRTGNRKKAFLTGLGVSFALGIAKELYDINHGSPELEDLFADAIGATAGAVIFTIPIKRKRKP
tara:strand:+ start:634 stop:1020 length:387 start_codon:yes stop_codon:yes gene_type:complete